MRVEPIGREPYYVSPAMVAWNKSIRKKIMEPKLPKDRTFEYILKQKMEKLRTGK